MFFINVDRSSNNPQFEAQAHRTQPQQFALVVLHQSQRFLFFIDLEANRVRTWHQMVQNPISSYIAASTADLMSSSMGKKCTAYPAVKLNVVLEDFFFILHDILAEMEEVTELQPVPDAHVPVMKLKFNGVSIDLLYASISLLVVPEDLDISDVSVLYNVDEPTLRSLNGCRVGVSVFKILLHVTRPTTVVLGNILETQIYQSLGRYGEALRVPSFLILAVESPILFANSTYLQERSVKIEGTD
ncbi:Nuclear poly(A) polymerase 4 [Camellia lanceoleosa]|uniref:Nuclear poly(A) polymerase 4 n=1 Tax=Camellia lanceoleosa TaxID=1840588 RepID=A0ACC0G6I0_9ERIC|nr:Nuclear poly(A) polymerase 4 [Camellia lanceoleosa]